jgi:hypothetical protein
LGGIEHHEPALALGRLRIYAARRELVLERSAMRPGRDHDRDRPGTQLLDKVAADRGDKLVVVIVELDRV